jgi:alkaline phosphatase
VDLNKDEFLNAFNPKIKSNYYSFDMDPYHFIVLDGNYIEDGTDYGRDVNWTWTDTWIHQEQKDWLIADLDSAGSKPTFIFIHQNLHDNSSISLNNSAEIREILENHGNVTHVFQGHHHPGHYEEINGIHYLTIMGMVDCPEEENRYASITVTGDTLYVEGHGAQPDYVLPHEGLLEAYTGIAAYLRDVPASVDTNLRMYDLRGRLVRLRTGACNAATVLITPKNRRKVYR